MKKNYYICLLLCTLGACNIKEQSEIQKEVLASETSISISADALLNSFSKDSSAAVDQYMGQVLSISGEVGIFEQLDTIAIHPNDSLPGIVKWFAKRLESDLNTSNIGFKAAALSTHKVPYTLNATFPKEYRKELIGVKEKSKVIVKGKLEHISTVSQTQPDSSKKPSLYILSLQGCVLESK